MATGVTNIYSAPEYSGGANGATWAHAGAHIVFGIVTSLVAWLVAAGLMFIIKRVVRTPVPVGQS